MTSRRSLATAAARESRALQFLPGHVQGRVASAQPVLRNDGSLRRWAVGGMDPSDDTGERFGDAWVLGAGATTATGLVPPPEGGTTITLRPTIIHNPAWESWGWYEAPVTGGSDALGDGADSTAAHLRYIASPEGYDTVGLRFEAHDVPADFVPRTMYVLLRAREVGTIPYCPGSVGWNGFYPYLGIDIAAGIYSDDWTPDYAFFGWHNHHSALSTPPMSSAYQQWDSRDNGQTPTGPQDFHIWEIPSADAIRNGLIEGLATVYHDSRCTPVDVYMDLAEVTLVICSDDTGDPASP